MTTLGRGLAAIGTIGALGLGSLLAAAPATAADHGVIETTPGAAFSVPAYFDVDESSAFRANRTTVRFTATGGATFTTTASLAAVTMNADGSTTRVEDLNANTCTLSSGNTVKTCIVNDTAELSAKYDFIAGSTYRYAAAMAIPANAQSGQTFTVNAVLSPATVNLTSSITYAIPAEAADIMVTSPAPDSTISAEGGVFTGTAEPGETIVITVDGSVLGSAVVAGDGTWSVTISGTLAEGQHQLTFTAGDKTVSYGYVVVDESEGNGVPVMPLAVGLGAGALALAGLGAYGIRRRIQN